MEGNLPRPPPPVVGKVTHHNIELYWEEALSKLNQNIKKGDRRVRVCIQEQDTHNQWGNVYTGYGKRTIINSLEPSTEYKYRMRFMNDAGNSEWSAHVTVSTTKEPLTGEHLHRAIMRLDLEELERILETGDVYIDTPDKLGFSPLMQAAQKGYLEILEKLLSFGADVHLKNDAGKTSLMLACFAGQLDSVKILRSNGANYEDFDRGGSAPLHWAVDGQNDKLVEWMIKDGAEVDIRDQNSGWTPLLRCASVTGNYDVASVLLMYGADINAQDNDRKTPLMIAILNGHFPLVELLLKRNADISRTNEFGKTAFEMALTMDKRRIIKTIEEHCDRKGIKIPIH
ncbi:fibronectin type 3 and ankyrin repeat domains 1 protein-like [Liolophura sinensis]|uniref:fibronectin type 3 and ankyrin repeat domains 1 protein-like n=1 Tax=Liolophura sinensis TaxID=3198878 RepID=UPI003158814B